jgi:hypothetical protein
MVFMSVMTEAEEAVVDIITKTETQLGKTKNFFDLNILAEQYRLQILAKNLMYENDSVFC